MFKEALENIMERTEGSLGALIMGIDGIAVERLLKDAGEEANLDVAAAEFTSLVRSAQKAGKDTGLGHFPSRDYGLNKAWLDASMTACILLSWLRHLALDGKLAKAEPKSLRYRVFHTAARLVRGGRRKTLKIAATWPWATAIITAWKRIQALPHPT